MENHSHDHQHELLYVHCGKCGSSAMVVMIMDGAILFDCADCKTEVGGMENIADDTQRLLSKGCLAH